MITGGMSIQNNGLTLLTGDLIEEDSGIYIKSDFVTATGLWITGGLTIYDSGISVTGGVTVYDNGVKVKGGLNVLSGGAITFISGMEVGFRLGLELGLD
jgi:hypothetical protein